MSKSLSEIKVNTPFGEGFLQVHDGVNVVVNGNLQWVVIGDIKIDEGSSGSGENPALQKVTMQLLENNQDYISNLKDQVNKAEESAKGDK
tara:strand:+ start:290 stop:559 length:270 start_codon:yes stop_codon:yes gene_type:complete